MTPSSVFIILDHIRSNLTFTHEAIFKMSTVRIQLICHECKYTSLSGQSSSECPKCGSQFVENCSLKRSRNDSVEVRNPRLWVNMNGMLSANYPRQRLSSGTVYSPKNTSKTTKPRQDMEDVASMTEGNCQICLEEIKHGNQIINLDNCSHHFHASCITTWIEKKNVCPICQAKAVNN